MAKVGFAAWTGLCIGVAFGLPAAAAVPTERATIAVSTLVVSSCNNTTCRTVPRVVSYGPARGGDGAPPFELSRDGSAVMTITY